MAESAPAKPRWNGGALLAAGELALVAGIFVADRHHWIPLSKTPFLFLLGWVSLRNRGLRWADLGLSRFGNWPRTLAIGVAVGIGMELLDLFVTKPLEVHLLGKPPDLSELLPLVGNLKLTVVALLLAWVMAALGEELVWRGYLLNRVAGLFKNARIGWTVGLILVSAAFGCAHAYQGLPGILQEGFAGLLLGIVYLACGRNLTVPIIAHGVTDSIDVVLIFTARYPGLSIH